MTMPAAALGEPRGGRFIPQPAPRRRQRWPRVAAAAVAAVLVLWAGLVTLVEWRTRAGLAFLSPAYEVSWQDASVHWSRLAVSLEGLRVVKPSAGGRSRPWLSAQRLEVRLLASEWLDFRPLAEVRLTGLQLNLIASRHPEHRQLEADVPDFFEMLEAALPFEADRVELTGARVTFVDRDRPDFPVVRISHLEGALENLSPASARARGGPSTLALSGTVHDEGEISLFFTADPLEKGRFFAGRVVLERFELSPFSKLLAEETGLALERGTIDLVAALECRDGQLTGGIRPTFRDTRVIAGKPGLQHQLGALLVDNALKALAEGASGGRLSKVIPIRGDLDRPEFRAWPLFTGALERAFQAGVGEGLERATLGEDSP